MNGPYSDENFVVTLIYIYKSQGSTKIPFYFYRALISLHAKDFVHADLKPANIMWSSYDGRFKLLDFGLTFHVDEDDLHQIQSPGYKAPETAEWNKYKDEIKKKRKRKLQGTYSDLTKAAPAYDKGLQKIGATDETPPNINTTPAGG